MDVRQLKVGPMENFCYLLAGTDGRAILVDPAWDVPALLAAATDMGVRVTDILVTHGHPDHIQGVEETKRTTGARVWAHERADHPVDETLSDGQQVSLAGIDMRVVHTPGHRFDAACFILDGTHILTGDTLFVGECGRIDLPGADIAAMHRTLLTTLAALPGDLVVLPGHDYGATPTSTLAQERETNYTLRPRTLVEFERFMRSP